VVELSRKRETCEGPVLLRRKVHRQFLIRQKHIDNPGATVCQDLLLQLAQVSLSAPLTAGLSGPRATVDTKAAPRPVKSALEAPPVGELSAVAAAELSAVAGAVEEDIMVAGVLGETMQCLGGPPSSLAGKHE
jgi:hypothetical protein